MFLVLVKGWQLWACDQSVYMLQRNPCYVVEHRVALANWYFEVAPTPTPLFMFSSSFCGNVLLFETTICRRLFFFLADMRKRPFITSQRQIKLDPNWQWCWKCPECGQRKAGNCWGMYNNYRKRLQSHKSTSTFKCDINSFLQIPFERQCRKNDTCIADLVVDFNFLYVYFTNIVQQMESYHNLTKCKKYCFFLRTPTLLVAENNKFDISVKLSNPGDDSYNTSLIMHYPAGLSFSMMVLTEVTFRLFIISSDCTGFYCF